MKRTWIVLLLVLFAVFGFSGAVSATLTTIGTATYLGSDYNLIFEGELGSSGLVWLDYTYRGTDGLGVSQSYAVSWWVYELSGDLTIDIAPGYTTTINWDSGWRLPTTVNGALVYGYEGDPDGDGVYSYTRGYNLANSEMGHLFYESLGNKGLYGTDGIERTVYGLKNTGPFENLHAEYYWSQTTQYLSSSNAWYLSFLTGYQSTQSKYLEESALAVHEGVVNSVPIPEPASMLLFGSGLLAWVGLRRRFKK